MYDEGWWQLLDAGSVTRWVEYLDARRQKKISCLRLKLWDWGPRNIAA